MAERRHVCFVCGKPRKHDCVCFSCEGKDAARLTRDVTKVPDAKCPRATELTIAICNRCIERRAARIQARHTREVHSLESKVIGWLPAVRKRCAAHEHTNGRDAWRPSMGAAERFYDPHDWIDR